MLMASTADEDEGENEKRVEIPHHIPPRYSEEIRGKAQSYIGETPARIHLEEWTLSRFQSLVSSIQAAHRKPQIRIGYSVKTSSTDEHLRHARKCGFLIECISQMEIDRALSVGVPRDEIILNGPGKFWPLNRNPVTGLHMLFCDSIEEFDRVLEIPGLARTLGFRIQLPNLPSRFGIPIDKIENFQRVLARVRKLKNKAQLGFHFHMPSWAIGVRRWKEAMLSLLTWCQAVEQVTKVPVQHLDLGGGFFPSDMEKIDFKWLQETVHEALPEVQAIYFEPGRSLTQEGEVLFSRVLDIRRSPDNKIAEVVVDACIAELPLIQSYAHRIFFQSCAPSQTTGFTHLKKGETKILGRICMENDVLSRGLDVPSSVELGDLIIFGDAGAYERSMSYDFGRG
jgi:diaminopimelate decarboxylase